MTTDNVYIEICRQPESDEWHVVAPSDDFDSSLIYDEIDVEFTYDTEPYTEYECYLYGGELVENERQVDETRSLDEIKSFTSTQKTKICFTETLLAKLYEITERLV